MFSEMRFINCIFRFTIYLSFLACFYILLCENSLHISANYRNFLPTLLIPDLTFIWIFEKFSILPVYSRPIYSGLEGSTRMAYVWEVYRTFKSLIQGYYGKSAEPLFMNKILCHSLPNRTLFLANYCCVWWEAYTVALVDLHHIYAPKTGVGAWGKF